MKIASLKLRAALTLSLMITVLWLTAAGLTARLLSKEMNEVFDSALQETGQRILQLAVIDILSREESGLAQHVAALDGHTEYYTYAVRDDLGRVLLTSHTADPAIFPDFQGNGFLQTPTHRVFQESAVRGTITITIAEPLSHRREVARELMMGLSLPLLLILPLTLAGIVYAVRYSLRPLARLQGQVARRDANDLAALPADDLPNELQPIAGAMNQLFQRLNRAFEAERSLASNAAHELRTPLAGAIAQVQRLRQETHEPETQRRAAEIEGTLKRLTRLTERLMQLARAEGARLRTGKPSDLRPVLRLVVDDLSRSGRTGAASDDSADQRLALMLPASPVLSDFDPDAFAIVSRNLIENALRHGSDAVVRIALSEGGELSVENDCAPIAPEVLAGLAERFARAPMAAEGSGLGLAIVGTIADRIGSTVTYVSPLPGTTRGFRASINLPLPAGGPAHG